jgi:heme-degrading monooxygenase HmoA
MYARVSEVTGPSDRIDAGIAQYRDSVLPQVQAMPGFQRAYLLVDRDNGKSLSITVWDAEESMQASDEAADRMRTEVAATMAAQASVRRYEIAVVEPAG